MGRMLSNIGTSSSTHFGCISRMACEDHTPIGQAVRKETEDALDVLMRVCFHCVWPYLPKGADTTPSATFKGHAVTTAFATFMCALGSECTLAVRI